MMEVLGSKRALESPDLALCALSYACRRGAMGIARAARVGLLLFLAGSAHSADLISVVDAAGGGGECGIGRGDGNNAWGGSSPASNPLGHNLGLVWLATGKFIEDPLGGVMPGPDSASCNDGSDPFMAIRPAGCAATSQCGQSGTGSESKRWIIHFQGGGTCKDGETCWERWIGAGESFNSCSKMSTRRFLVGAPAMPGVPVVAITGKGIVGDDAIAPSELIEHYNLVFLDYCSSDQWVGNQAAPTDLNNGANDYAIYFQGHRILAAIVDRLMAPGGVTASDGQSVPSLADASQIVLTGDSAGGGGMVNNALWFFDAVNAGGASVSADRFVTVVDAGNDRPFEADGFDQLVTKVKNEYDSVRSHPDLWNWFGGNSDCNAYHAGPGVDSPHGAWACGYSNHLIANHWRFPTMLREDLRDPVNGDLSLAWAQDAVEGFKIYRSVIPQGTRFLDTRHAPDDEGSMWYLGQWLGVADPGYSQGSPEIPADLKLPPEDGFSGIPEENPPPVLVTFAPNCRLHDAAVNNEAFSRHKVLTSTPWWHGGSFASFHDILFDFLNAPDILAFDQQVWDWDTHDPRTWLDDSYAGLSDCDNDGVIAADDCNDNDPNKQIDCDGDLLIALAMGGTDCDDANPGLGVVNDCDADGEPSLALGAGGDCNDLDPDVGNPALLGGGSEDFDRGDGRNACFDLEDNDCDGLVDCDESECQYGCTLLAPVPPLPTLGPRALALTALLLVMTTAALLVRRRAG